MTPEQLRENLQLWPEDEVCRYLASEVRRVRLATGESQRDFAERAGVPLRTYKRFETHGRAHLDTFIRALRTLGRTEYLFMLFPVAQTRKAATLEQKLLHVRMLGRIDREGGA
jgi:transcriptional regulator with XRE-family HTH domain